MQGENGETDARQVDDHSPSLSINPSLQKCRQARMHPFQFVYLNYGNPDHFKLVFGDKTVASLLAKKLGLSGEMKEPSGDEVDTLCCCGYFKRRKTRRAAETAKSTAKAFHSRSSLPFIEHVKPTLPGIGKSGEERGGASVLFNFCQL